MIKRGALRDLVPFVQLKNVKNTHGGVLLSKACNLTKCKLLHGCFLRGFLYFIDVTKSRNTPHVDGHFKVTITNFRNGKNFKIIVIVNYNKSKKM